MERFSIKSGGIARIFWPFVRGPQHVLITDEEIRIRIGRMGHAELPLVRVIRIGKMNWPWWAGAGVRIGVKIVAFVTRPGQCVLIEMDEPTKVYTPLGWRTPRVAVSVDDPDGLARAIDHARSRAIAADTASA